MPSAKVKTANLPEELAPLAEIARNLWWSWTPDAQRLFEYIDPELLSGLRNSPWNLLGRLTARRAKALTRDRMFIDEMNRVAGRLRQYLKAKTWYAEQYGGKAKGLVAYFCMEYGLHESLPLYAGGLGVLAGDHLKSASDLGLPLVAVGIYWHRGYTRQIIDQAGCQQDHFPHLPPEYTPAVPVMTRGRKPIRVRVPLGGRTILATAWRLQVGRVPLYLLDTNLPENEPRDRELVDVLYAGDRDARIRQEILLGIGGWRLLELLGLDVTACHLNEGHAAFISLERLARRMVETNERFPKALKAIRDTTVFTTHTPVPAGNEEFDPALVDAYLAPYIDQLGISHTQFHDLARIKPGNTRESFGLTPLALRTARYSNGVAALHGKVARSMWRRIYPGRPAAMVPIGHVTNGIHLRTWLHPEMGDLLDEVLGGDWDSRQDQPALWNKVRGIPDEALWDVHHQLKGELIELCRRRALEEARRNGGPLAESGAEGLLDPQALTIGFARRFAPYKRADLIFNDPARLARILNDRQRPVQLIFAGKAHPMDAGGKAIIQRIVKLSRTPRFRKRVLLIENYDMAVGRALVAGVDVWLNNPQRPREASGTSGMKPPLHGGVNLSILDGWWPESFNGRNGWAIGKGKDWTGPEADRQDAEDLYRLLETKVVPLYYERDEDGLPRGWLSLMKESLATIPVQFNSHRQVKEYLTKYYLPALRKAKS